MLKLLAGLFKGFEIIFRFFYGIVALVLITLSMYLLGGHAYLSGMWGTDTRSIIGMLLWINKFFPNVPFWYPLAGGGISLTHSYPVFSLYLVSLVERITSLNIFESFSLLGFASILIFAISIYVFVSLRLKSQTTALIAAIFYLISPIAWTWLTDWGFYAESASHIFAIPALLFWDLYFTSFVEGKFGVKTRIYLAFAIVFAALGSAMHFALGLGLLGIIFIYIAGYLIKSKKEERKQLLVRSLLALLIFAIFLNLATLAFRVPYQNYTKVTAQAGVGSPNNDLEAYRESLPSYLHLWGFASYKKDDFLFAMNHFKFPIIVSVFGFVGTLFFSWKDKRKFTLALFAVVAFASISPYFLYYFTSRFPGFLWFIPSSYGWRETFIFQRAVWPIVAAVGVVGIVSLPFFWIKNKFLKPVKGVIVTILALSLAGLAILSEGDIKKFSQPSPPIYGYGTDGINTRNIWDKVDENGNRIGVDNCPGEGFETIEDEEQMGERTKDVGGYERWCGSAISSYFPPLAVADWCDIQKRQSYPETSVLCTPETFTKVQAKEFWEGCKKGKEKSSLCERRYFSIEEQLSLSNWPSPKLQAEYFADAGLGEALNKIALENPDARIDFSPYLSNYSMVAPIHNLNRNLSQIHVYVTTASLIHRFQGWQQIVYYLNDPQYHDEALVNDIARWFGINYIFLVPNQYGYNDIFEKAGWEVFQGAWGNGILKFPEKNSLADFSNKSSVLVVGQKRVSAYDQVLTVSLLGVLPYNEAFLIWGRDNIDSYSQEELERFDVVVLQGYSYKNLGKANELLYNYVNSGGKVFIDTGWQYTSPDWESTKTLDIIPLNQLEWSDLGKTKEYKLEDEEFSQDIDASAFAPLIYQDSSWGVSTSDRSELKQWGKVALSTKGKPLIVTGRIGEGRVVWSGMNIFPHVKQSDKIYSEEIKFLRGLFTWLIDGKTDTNFDVTYKRINPDRVEFFFNEDAPEGGYLLWKEGYYPYFKAKIEGGENLSIYRAGPGWTLIKIPKATKGEKLIYEYKTPVSEEVAFFASILTFILLLLIIIEGVRGERSLFVGLLGAIEKRFVSAVKLPKSILGKDTEEYDY